ncbi:hypothetical protein FDN13_10265 [Caloramator sp. E03]|uniref:hypothetical protein n=1 Tax=Caloramator sp. E03 TaxID=2576307 RepID=UPI00110FFCC6|nr:hypothetical protein [Caloramator sp. E03]QCX34058.1 hypothetical protein FDN13_10265 [Caloramator sp. E03]
MLVFTSKNIYRTFEANYNVDFSKDTAYRFLNSLRFNWKKYLLLLSSSIIKNTLAVLTSHDRVNVLIVDDSMYSKNRSKSVELLA